MNIKIKLASIVRLKTGNNHEWENQLGIVTDLWSKTKGKIKNTTYRVAIQSSKEEYNATMFEVTGDKLEIVHGVGYVDLSPYILHRYAKERGYAKKNIFMKEVRKANLKLFEDYLSLVNKHKDFKVKEDSLSGEWAVAVYRIYYNGEEVLEIRRTPILDEGFRLADTYEKVVNGVESGYWDKHIGRMLKYNNAIGRLNNDRKASIVLRYLENKS